MHTKKKLESSESLRLSIYPRLIQQSSDGADKSLNLACLPYQRMCFGAKKRCQLDETDVENSIMKHDMEANVNAEFILFGKEKLYT